MEWVFIFILVAVLVAFFVRSRNSAGGGPLKPGQASQFVQGTLTLTGVAERPEEGDSKGDRYCTLSGTIVGPDGPTEVYATLVFGENEPWPQVGADMPVVYKPGKADSSWRFGTLPDPGDQPHGPQDPFGSQDPPGPNDPQGPQDPGQQPPPGFQR